MVVGADKAEMGCPPFVLFPDPDGVPFLRIVWLCKHKSMPLGCYNSRSNCNDRHGAGLLNPSPMDVMLIKSHTDFSTF